MSTAVPAHEEKPIGHEVKVDHGDDSELSSVGDDSLELTPAEERRLRRIVDWRILPYCSLLYLLSAYFRPPHSTCFPRQPTYYFHRCISLTISADCFNRFLGPGAYTQGSPDDSFETN